MSVCTFFGHHDCPSSVKPVLRAVLVDLIENRGVDEFYVGNNGAFDALVRSCLRELVKLYPWVNYAVVLTSMPRKRDESDVEEFRDTVLPEGIEEVHPHYAVIWRNRWMLRKADIVVSYVIHSWGGAARFEETAKKQGKEVIELAGCFLSPENVIIQK